MAIDKMEYLRETFGHMDNKTFENYVCNRLWAKIDDPNLKPVTQQYVKRNDNGRRALLDLYFPQIQAAVEVNEAHHLSSTAQQSDKIRQEEVKAAVPGLTLFEIWEAEEQDDGQKVLLSMEDINQQIDDAAYLIRSKIKKQCRDTGDPLVWDDDAAHERKIAEIRKRGVLTTKDAVLFKTSVSVLNEIFDKGFGAFMKSGRWFGDERFVWFPKIGPFSKEWENRFEDNKNRFLQQWIGDGEMPPVTWRGHNSTVKRAVFAGERNSLGEWGYTFAGIYRFTVDLDKAEVCERVSEELNIAEWQKADEA